MDDHETMQYKLTVYTFHCLQQIYLCNLTKETRPLVSKDYGIVPI